MKGSVGFSALSACAGCCESPDDGRVEGSGQGAVVGTTSGRTMPGAVVGAGVISWSFEAAGAGASSRLTRGRRRHSRRRPGSASLQAGRMDSTCAAPAEPIAEPAGRGCPCRRSQDARPAQGVRSAPMGSRAGPRAWAAVPGPAHVASGAAGRRQVRSLAWVSRGRSSAAAGGAGLDQVAIMSLISLRARNRV